VRCNQSPYLWQKSTLFEPYCNAGYIVNASGDRNEINTLRDTAALQSLISKSCILLDFVIHLDEVRWIRGISGNIMEIPLVQVWLESKYCNENVTVDLSLLDLVICSQSSTCVLQVAVHPSHTGNVSDHDLVTWTMSATMSAPLKPKPQLVAFRFQSLKKVHWAR